MPESFNAFEFADHARRRASIFGWLVGCALAAAVAVTIALPKEYTATASILIDSPAASDPRISTAVSPIYLESLKTYEQFAGSDSLFARACETFHLLESNSGQPIESFKKRVLTVTKPKETKLLEISITLHDPMRAQAVAQFLAQETVALSVRVSEGRDREVLERTRSELAVAAKQLINERRRFSQGASADIAELDSEIMSLSHTASSLGIQLGEAEGVAAEAAARFDEMNRARSGDAAYCGREAVAARGRAEALRRSAQDTDRTLHTKAGLLARAKGEQLENEGRLRSAEVNYDQLFRRVSDLEAAVGTRSEQLRIIDPGVVPQKPSSPNLVLNCVAALVSSLVLACALMCLSFSIERHRLAHQRPPLQVARRGTA